MREENSDDDSQGFPDRADLARRLSNDTIISGLYPDFWSQLQGTPIQTQSTREKTFYEKILPGLNSFVMLEDSHPPQFDMENELDGIDPCLFAHKSDIETSPQQFFNFIEHQDEYEQLKNKKIGILVSPKTRPWKGSSKIASNRATTTSLTANYLSLLIMLIWFPASRTSY
jgi:hypothetical protein